jgi:FtsZ-binding cell division protein ZapB
MNYNRNSRKLTQLLVLGLILLSNCLIAQNKTTSTVGITDFEAIQKNLPKGLYLLNEKGFQNVIQIETSYTSLKEKFSIVEVELSNTKSENTTLRVKNSQLESDNKTLVDKVEALSKKNVVLQGISAGTIIFTLIKLLN